MILDYLVGSILQYDAIGRWPGYRRTSGFFFMHVVPAPPDGPSADRRPPRVDKLDFRFVELGVASNGKCVLLPVYDALAIGAGRLPPNGRQAWRTDIRPSG